MEWDFMRIKQTIHSLNEMEENESARLGMPHVESSIIILINAIYELAGSDGISSSQLDELRSFIRDLSDFDAAFKCYISYKGILPVGNEGATS